MIRRMDSTHRQIWEARLARNLLVDSDLHLVSAPTLRQPKLLELEA
jgi:hypothetical protein